MNLFDCTSPRFISMSAWLPMCLNPVSVSVKLTPSALAMVLRILEDTVEARKWTFSSGTLLSPLCLWHSSSHQPSNPPISFPDRIFHVPSPLRCATPSLSASGSLARM